MKRTTMNNWLILALLLPFWVAVMLGMASWNLDKPLLHLTKKDPFTLRDSFEGVHFFGGIGSGKTSSAKLLAKAMLRAGYGGLVCTVKPDEIALWESY